MKGGETEVVSCAAARLSPCSVPYGKSVAADASSVVRARTAATREQTVHDDTVMALDKLTTKSTSSLQNARMQDFQDGCFSKTLSCVFSLLQSCNSWLAAKTSEAPKEQNAVNHSAKVDFMHRK